MEYHVKRKTHQIIACIGLATLIASYAPAFATDEPAADPGRSLLDAFLNDVETLSARFDQQLVDADGIIVEESSGTLEIQRPGQFRWAYELPYEQIMVADGLNIWSYDVDLEQVTVKGQADVLSSTPALLLGGDHGVLDDFEYVKSESDRGTVWVELRPYNSDNGFTKIEMGFNEGKLRRMVFLDNLQQSTLIALFDLQLNQNIDPARFEFVPPENADLVGEPLLETSASD